MERDIEKDLIEIECAIKSQEEKDNIFTMSVLQRCHKLVSQLKEYKDLEEQGKLLKLPCAVGDTVYRINKGSKEPIILMKVCEVGVISLKSGAFVMQIMCRDELDNGETHYLSTDFGKSVFLTGEEAEAALKEYS